MPYGAHETMEVHEVLGGTLNMLGHFSLYLQLVQDEQIRDMLGRHMETAAQSYDQLLAYTHDYSAAEGAAAPVWSLMNGIKPEHIEYGLRNPAPHVPQLHGAMNDEQILCAMLSCHKNSAKLHMNAALECADPNVRRMLGHGAVACSNAAYEVFVLMNERGLYQVPTMDPHTAKTLLHSYQPVRAQSYSVQPAERMTGYASSYSAQAGDGGYQSNRGMNPSGEKPMPFGYETHQQIGGSGLAYGGPDMRGTGPDYRQQMSGMYGGQSSYTGGPAAMSRQAYTPPANAVTGGRQPAQQHSPSFVQHRNGYSSAGGGMNGMQPDFSANPSQSPAGLGPALQSAFSNQAIRQAANQPVARTYSGSGRYMQ